MQRRLNQLLARLYVLTTGMLIEGHEIMGAINRVGPDPIDVAVGSRIPADRRATGSSQTQLAEAIDITFQQIQKFECGANRAAASMLVRIAASLETSVAALVGEEGASALTIIARSSKSVSDDMTVLYDRVTSTDSRRALVTLAKALAMARA